MRIFNNVVRAKSACAARNLVVRAESAVRASADARGSARTQLTSAVPPLIINRVTILALFLCFFFKASNFSPEIQSPAWFDDIAIQARNEWILTFRRSLINGEDPVFNLQNEMGVDLNDAVELYQWWASVNYLLGNFFLLPPPLPPQTEKNTQKGDNFFRFSKFSLQSLVTFW